MLCLDDDRHPEGNGRLERKLCFASFAPLRFQVPFQVPHASAITRLRPSVLAR
jgi:hypothetical protein